MTLDARLLALALSGCLTPLDEDNFPDALQSVYCDSCISASKARFQEAADSSSTVVASDYEVSCEPDQVAWTEPEGCDWTTDGAVECLDCLEQWDWDVLELQVHDDPKQLPIEFSCNLTGMDEVCVEACAEVYDCGSEP